MVRVPLDTLDEQTQQEYWKNKAAEAAGEQSADTPSAHAQPKEDAPQTKTKKTKKAKKTPKKKRKSHPRTTKNCRCSDREHCDHAWINADEGAGTVVKSTGKMYWAHKASTLGFAKQEVLLDAVALNDAASHDSKSLVPHLSRLLSRHPDLSLLRRICGSIPRIAVSSSRFPPYFQRFLGISAASARRDR